MKTNMYCIFDVISEVFNKPFTQINDGAATRDFIEGVKDSVHKNDLVLYHIGQFDDNAGVLFPNATPKKLYSGIEVKVAESITPEMQMNDLKSNC